MEREKQCSQLVTINIFKIGYRLFFITLSLVFLQCNSVQQIHTNNNAPMDIYLCIGQSNMAGRAPIEPIDKDTLTNVFLYTGHPQNSWEKAATPLNKYSTVRKKLSMQKLNPAYTFAKTLSNEQPNQKIGLVVNAKGGTSIEEWEPGNLLYSQALEQTKKALANGGNLKGIIWHQGESNSSNYKNYINQLTALITAFRKDLNSPKLPFVVGQLSTDKPKRIAFNNMLLTLPKKVKNTAVVSSEKTSTIDKTHFDSKSQRILGIRYAKKMLYLTSKK